MEPNDNAESANGANHSSSNDEERFEATAHASRLIEQVCLLAQYALERGELPDDVSISDLYEALSDIEQGKGIAAKQLRMLTTYYQLLERRFPTITAQSLKATQPEEPGLVRTSPAGRYLRRLWRWIAGVIFLIFLMNLTQYIHDTLLVEPGEAWTVHTWSWNVALKASQYLEPFLYGALGSFVFILRVTEERLRTREFDPARAPEHFNRLVLGTLSGGSIILFVAQVPTEDGGYLQIGTAALGFLAGYSIDFLFETLDRIIRAILPKVGLETIQRRSQKRYDEEIIRRYQKMHDQATDEGQKKILTEIIGDLRAR